MRNTCLTSQFPFYTQRKHHLPGTQLPVHGNNSLGAWNGHKSSQNPWLHSIPKLADSTQVMKLVGLSPQDPCPKPVQIEMDSVRCDLPTYYTIALCRFLLNTFIIHHNTPLHRNHCNLYVYISLVFWPAQDSTSPGWIHSPSSFSIWSQGTWSHPPRSFGSSSSQERYKLELRKISQDFLYRSLEPILFHPNHQVFFPTALQCQLMNSNTWVSERGPHLIFIFSNRFSDILPMSRATCWAFDRLPCW